MSNGDSTIWSEKIPGQQQQPQFFKVLQALMQANQQQPQSGVGGIGPRPAQVGATLPSPRPPVSGGMAASMPTLSPQPMSTVGYGGPASGPRVQPPNIPYSYPTQAARNMAVTQSAIQGISGAVTKFKQDRWQKEAAQAEQVWTNYTALQTAAENEQDPRKKQQIQDMANKLLQDKNAIKILEKAQKDPMSGAAIGLQRAMQVSQQQAVQQAQLQEALMKAKAEEARAHQEQATAALRLRQAQLEGQVTPKVKYEGETKIHEAEIKEQGSIERIKIQQEGANQRNRNSINGMLQATQRRVDAMKDIASGKQGDKTIDYFTKQYNGILSQIKELDSRQKALQTSIDKTDKWYLPTSDENKKIQAQIQQIEVQRGLLEKDLAHVEENRKAAIQGGVSALAAIDEKPPIEEPIVVSPEDMK